ncbi:MAG: acyl-CoA thioesterase [Chloroflexi bacterium]|nr:acyl-CoA thioesterase [Chloroflexota bacterium]
MADTARPDPVQFSQRWRVRTYEVDENGHVNNAVYLQWAEHLSAEHAEAMGFGREWALARGCAWLIRRHEITYHLPARRADEIELTVRVIGIGGVRGRRHTEVRRAADGVLLAEVTSEWVYVGVADGRPTRVPAELVKAFSPVVGE